MPEKLYRVRAGNGIVIPLPEGIAVDTTTRVLTQNDIVNVREDRFTRRCLANGDFVIVEEADPTVADKPDDSIVTSAEREHRHERARPDRSRGERE